jgi:uncharacterized protein
VERVFSAGVEVRMNKWVKRVLLFFGVALVVGVLIVGYSYFVEPRQLRLNTAELRVPNFDSKLNGLKVVAIADIHGGSNYVTQERLREIVKTTNDQKPDVVVLLGDFVSQVDGNKGPLKMPMSEIAENLKGFDARFGVYAVIGNHDWWYDETIVHDLLETAGINVLENEVATVDVGGEPLHIWGIEDLWRRRAVPSGPFDGLADKRNVIAITHNPDSLLRSPAGISLMLAGHSHGGQIDIPFYGRESFVTDPRLMYGEVVIDGKHIFITAGVGTSILPLRFRVPPEIAVLTIYSAD